MFFQPVAGAWAHFGWRLFSTWTFGLLLVAPVDGLVDVGCGGTSGSMGAFAGATGTLGFLGGVFGAMDLAAGTAGSWLPALAPWLLALAWPIFGVGG